MRAHKIMMQLHQTFYAIASILMLLVGGTASARELPSTVIFPPQRMPLAFSHKLHLAKHVKCDFCHEKAPTSHAASDDLIPSEDVCSTCHEIDRAHPERSDKEVTACQSCHPGFDPKKPELPVEKHVIPAPNLRFDHAAHTSRGVACQKCHGDMTQVELASPRELPQMGLCLTCHDSRRGQLHAPSRCATCHLVKQDGTLKTQFPSGTLSPSGSLRGDGHGLSFRTNHAQVAREDERYCLSCHRQDECQQCHNGVVKPLDFHGNDYVSRHAVDARRNSPNCQACHRLQSFCLGCHERLGVTDLRTAPNPGFVPLGSRTFHPAGWADPSAAGNPNHHAWQAQRNLKQCVSCHRQETCLECHGAASGAGRFGKMSVDPHPPGWRGSQRCESLADRNARVCLQCHAPDDPHVHCR